MNYLTKCLIKEKRVINNYGESFILITCVKLNLKKYDVYLSKEGVFGSYLSIKLIHS